MPVEIREETLEMKTYLPGPEDPFPPLQRRGYWSIYPYSLLDDLGEEVRTVAYRALVVENEYLRVIVLPELGGHLLSAVDKSTGEELFYHNHVVKPGLIALRGGWVSGGIEWNFPRGHTVTTISPVDGRIVQENDGSGTIWVGNVEQIHRMAWAVGIRLRPGSSVIETDIRLANRTSLPHPYYFWANAAVPARDDMHLVYPATKVRTWQGETAWPIHEGRDLSRYSAFPGASDSFMLDSLEDFFGVYYDERDFGVVHLANVHECFGKKYFTWGTADAGRMWASILSDDDGPYCEIQSGRYVDQSTYRLLPPHHTEQWLEHWYPVKGIGGFAFANLKAAIRIAQRDEEVDCGVSVTRPFVGAAVRLSSGDRVLYEARTDLSPDTPVRFGVPKGPDWPSAPLRLALLDAGGRDVISYTENQPPRTLTLSESSDADATPNDTPGALLQEAIHIEQAGGRDEARAAYQKALDADPACLQALIAMGRLLISPDLDAAVRHLSRAASLAPESAEAAYYLGCALRRADRPDDATVELWRSAHSPAFAHTARVELALIAMRDSDWDTGAQTMEWALSYDPEDMRAWSLFAAALRRAGKVKQATSEIEEARESAPHDRLATAETYFCAKAAGRPRTAASRLRQVQALLPQEPDPWIELAFDYADAGMTEEAVELLETASKKLRPVRKSPLVCYALAYWLGHSGREEEAARRRKQARALSPQLVFPHHWEFEAILRNALEHDPSDGPARYYLGTLLYSLGRHDEGLAEWQQAAPRMRGSVVLNRNLGLAYRHRGDRAKAATALRRAVSRKPSHQRPYLELEEVLRELKADPQRRLTVLDSAPPEVQRRSMIAAQEITACVELGQWDRAATLLTTHSFHRWEAEFRMRGLYVDAYLGRGAEKFDLGDLAGARQDFEAALEYPANLRIGRPAQTEDSRAHWCAGLVCEALGDMAAAKAHWEAAADETYRKHSHSGALDRSIFRALCLAKLGRADEAGAALEEELDTARAHAEAEPENAAAHMMLGLALKAADRAAEAEAPLKRALELYPWLPRARRLLAKDVIL